MIPRGPRSVPTTILTTALGAAAALGLIDVARHGEGLDAPTAAATVGLWVALALPIAGAAALAAAAWSARSERGRRRAPTGPRALGRAGLASLVAAPLLAAGLAAGRYDPPFLPPAPDREPPHTEPRNVVLIVLDTLRADHVGALGHDGHLTPQLDELASRATSFEQCFAPASWTVPSHASLFTGLFPVSHGASFAHAPRLEDRFTTVAEGLREAGYRTAAFVANPHLARANLDQGFELYREVTAPFAALALRRPLAALGGPARWIDEGASQTAHDVAAFLADREQRGDGSALLLFINLLEPHWRHLPPAAQRRDALTQQGYVSATLAASRFYGPLAMAHGALDPEDLAAVRALYAAEVRYQDALLGQLLASIDRYLDPRRTLLIVTADHGENLGEGGRFDHIFALNDHLIRVPLLLRLPDHFPPGTRRRDLCQLLDVPATVREVLGPVGEAIPTGAGSSLVTPRPARRRYVYAEGDPYLHHLPRMRRAGADPQRLAEFARPLRAVRDAQFKLVWSADTDPALYDLADDPDELRNIASEQPARARRLALELEQWYAAQTPYVAGPPADPDSSDAATREHLEALGYAQ